MDYIRSVTRLLLFVTPLFLDNLVSVYYFVFLIPDIISILTSIVLVFPSFMYNWWDPPEPFEVFPLPEIRLRPANLVVKRSPLFFRSRKDRLPCRTRFGTSLTSGCLLLRLNFFLRISSDTKSDQKNLNVFK